MLAHRELRLRPVQGPRRHAVHGVHRAVLPRPRAPSRVAPRAAPRPAAAIAAAGESPRRPGACGERRVPRHADAHALAWFAAATPGEGIHGGHIPWGRRDDVHHLLTWRVITINYALLACMYGGLYYY